MTLLIVLIAMIGLALAVAATGLARDLRHDGLGHRPGPRSHADDSHAPNVFWVAPRFWVR